MSEQEKEIDPIPASPVMGVLSGNRFRVMMRPGVTEESYKRDMDAWVARQRAEMTPQELAEMDAHAEEGREVREARTERNRKFLAGEELDYDGYDD